MSSLAVPTDNHVELSSVDSCHDSTISRPRYLVLQSLVGIMLAYQLLSGAELHRKSPNDRGDRHWTGGDGLLPVVCADLDLTGRVVQRDRDRDRYGSRDRDYLSFG